MHLSCPTNWDAALLDQLAGLPVAELYGQLDDDPVGGGRARYLQAHTPLARAAAHIRQARDGGLGFTYLLNAPCLDNREYRAAFRGALGERLRWAVDAGVTGVTVSVPLLAELVKQQFPGLWVKVSVIAHVGSLRRLRMWEDLGADEVTVDFERNRDLALLEALAGAARCELSLLVNDLCLLDCAWRHYHYNVSGHASQASHDGALVDYCFLRCHRLKVQQPIELLRSPWIRPEDLTRYEALGIGRFKLAGRTKPTATIAAIASAYAERRSPENLLGVLAGTGRDTDGLGFAALEAAARRAPGLLGKGLAALGRLPAGLTGRGHFVELMAQLPSQAREELLPAFVALMRLSETVRIDGRALDGFLDGFAGRRCGVECESCPHCEQWAGRAVTVDTARAAEIVAALERAIDGVVSGRVLPG
ncbi:MAG: U32 family peptidase [Pseudomonadota bacterium]